MKINSKEVSEEEYNQLARLAYHNHVVVGADVSADEFNRRLFDVYYRHEKTKVEKEECQDNVNKPKLIINNKEVSEEEYYQLVRIAYHSHVIFDTNVSEDELFDVYYSQLKSKLEKEECEDNGYKRKHIIKIPRKKLIQQQTTTTTAEKLGFTNMENQQLSLGLKNDYDEKHVIKNPTKKMQHQDGVTTAENQNRHRTQTHNTMGKRKSCSDFCNDFDKKQVIKIPTKKMKQQNGVSTARKENSQLTTPAKRQSCWDFSNDFHKELAIKNPRMMKKLILKHEVTEEKTTCAEKQNNQLTKRLTSPTMRQCYLDFSNNFGKDVVIKNPPKKTLMLQYGASEEKTTTVGKQDSQLMKGFKRKHSLDVNNDFDNEKKLIEAGRKLRQKTQLINEAKQKMRTRILLNDIRDLPPLPSDRGIERRRRF